MSGEREQRVEHGIDSLPGGQAEGLAGAGWRLQPLSDRSDEEERDDGRAHGGGIEEEYPCPPACQERRFVDVGNHEAGIFARADGITDSGLSSTFGGGMLRRSFHWSRKQTSCPPSNPSGFSEDFMKRRWRVFLVGGFFLLAIVLPASITFYTDWLWFGEMGYQEVFARTLAAQGTLGSRPWRWPCVSCSSTSGSRCGWSLRGQMVVHTREGPLAIAIDRRRMQPLGTAVVVALAVLFGLFGSGQWQEWLLFRYAQPFGDVDPILGQRRQLLCLPDALSGSAQRISARAGPARGRHRRRRLRSCGGDRPRSEPRATDCGSGEAASGGTRRRAPAGDGVRRISRRAPAAHRVGRHRLRRRERRRGGPDPGAPGADGRRARRLGAGAVPDDHQLLVAAHCRRRPLRRDDSGRVGGRGGHAAVHHRAERTGPRDAVHRAQHQGHAQGVCAGQRRGTGVVGRCAAHPRRHRRERGHARQRPAVGSPAAAADVRADSGDPHLLRLRLGPQRPVQDRRPLPADHALGARARFRHPAEPQLDQRTSDVHPWIRHRAGTGEPGHAGGPARAVHQGHPAAVFGGPEGRGAEHLLRTAFERVRVRQDEGSGVPLSEGRGQRLRELRGQRRRAGLQFLPAAALQHSISFVEGAVERGHHERQPRDVPSTDVGARRVDCAVLEVRPGSVPRDLERPFVLGAGRVHDHRPLSRTRPRRAAASTTSATP